MTGQELLELRLIEDGHAAAFDVECAGECSLVTLAPLAEPLDVGLTPVDCLALGFAVGVVVSFGVLAAFLESIFTHVRQLEVADELEQSADNLVETRG